MVEVDDQALVGEAHVGEDGAGLVEQDGLVKISLGIMAQDEMSHTSLTGNSGGLKGGAVVSLVGLETQAVVIGGLMVQPVHALDVADDAARELGIAAIGVADGRVGWRGELVVGDDETLGGHPVLTLSQGVHGIMRHPQALGLLAVDVAQLGLLGDNETHGRDAVQQGECGYRDGIVLVDNRLVGVDDVEAHLKGALAAKVVEHPREQVNAVLEGVNGEGIGAIEQRHGRYQPRQPEAVVTVEVADEDVVEAHELESHAPHAQLSALAAVDHHEVVAHIEDLARGTVPGGHCGAAAAQYVKFQSRH